MHRVFRHLAALCLWGWAALAFASGDRIALVIGNATYQSAPLANPVNDASDVANRLRGLGFTVIAGNNLDRDGMVRKVQEFRAALKPGGVGLFFYSGHGVEVGGLNYLLPVNNDGIRTVEDVEIYGLEAQRLVRQMEAAGTQLNVVILDACRNNPLPARVRSASKGLGRMDAQQGTLIAYATREGQTAADGGSRNSPYTQALLHWLGEPGLEVAQMFNRVGLDVSRATAGAQVPWVSSSPVPALMLAGMAAVPAAALQPASPSPFDPRQADLAFWQGTQQANTLAAYRAYKQRYPNGDYVALADMQIDRFGTPVPVQTLPSVLESTAQSAPASTAGADANGFVDRGNGVLFDTHTGLEWTERDNGSDIDWDNAGLYCANLPIAGGGWRLPLIDELAAIHARPGVGTTACPSVTCKVSPAFRLSSNWFWSGTRMGSLETWIITLINGHRLSNTISDRDDLRALCVRRRS